MKATGIIRRIDDLGRVVIPKEICRTLKIREGDPMEIYLENGGILLTKHNPIGDMNFTPIMEALKRKGIKAMVVDRKGQEMGEGNTLHMIHDMKATGLFLEESIPHLDEEHNTFVAPIIYDGEYLGALVCTGIIDPNGKSAYVACFTANIIANMI